MRVLVTGANGFLGRHLCAVLVERGDTPVAISLDRTGLPAGVEHVELDVREREALAAAVDHLDPEVVVHLAALSHVGTSWKQIADYFAVNFEGTANLLAAASGRRILFASSAEVYGAVPESELPIAEERPPAPRSPYALTKAAGERIALDAGATVVRLFNLLGPGQAPTFALPGFAAQLAAIAAGAAEPVIRVGNLEARRDFVHVLDAVDALLTLATTAVPPPPTPIFNLASGRASSIAEMLDRLIRVSGVAARIEVDAERLRPADIPVLAGDASRLAARGWRARRGIDAALSELWDEALALHGRPA